MNPTQLPMLAQNTLNSPIPSQAAMDAMAQGGALLPTDANSGPAGENQPSSTGSLPGPSALLNSQISGSATLDQRLPGMSAQLKRFAAASDRVATQMGPAAAAPGGWSRALVAGAQAMMGGLGDAAAASEPAPGGGGALSGITRTLQARGQRIEGQRREQFQEGQEKERTAMMRAETNMRLIGMQQNIYRQNQEVRNEHMKQGSAFIDSQRSLYDRVTDGVTQDQFDKMAKDPNFWETHTGRQTGEAPVFKDGKEAIDADGHLITSPLYSIIDLTSKKPAAKHLLSAQEAEYLTTNNTSGQKFSKDTDVTGAWDGLNAKAMSVHASREAIEKANGEDFASAQRSQVNAEVSDPAIQNYMSKVPGMPLAGLDQAKTNAQNHIAAIDQKIAALRDKPGSEQAIAALVNGDGTSKNPGRNGYLNELQKVNHVIDFNFNETAKKDYATWQNKTIEDAETRRHNLAEENLKAQEIATKKALEGGGFQGDQNLIGNQFVNQTGPDKGLNTRYLGSLKPDERPFVYQAAKGQMDITNMARFALKNPGLFEAVSIVNPEFESAKAKTYPDMVKDFTSGKGVAKALNSLGATLHHLKELYDDTSFVSGLPLATEAAHKRDADLNAAALEYATFLNGGNQPGKEDVQAQRAALTSINPYAAKAAITKVVTLLDEKLRSFEQQWANGAPSKQYQRPMPGISKESYDARDYILNDGKAPAATTPFQKAWGATGHPGTVPAEAPPTGATMKVPGSDGRWYWSDGKNNLGPVQ